MWGGGVCWSAWVVDLLVPRSEEAKHMSSTVVIVWVALLAAMFFFQFVPMIFASSQQCAVHVNPTRDQRTNTNCSEVQCSWNEALNWCSHNRSDALEWLLVLEPGIFSSVPLTLRTPIGRVI